MFYENFFNSVKPDMDYIPESATFQDAAAFANRAIQDAYTEAVINISSREMAIFESTMYGKEVSYVTEASGFLDTIKNFFSNLWDKIKGFFGKIYQMIKQLFARISIAGGKVTQADFDKAYEKLKDDFKVKGVFDPKRAEDFTSKIGPNMYGIYLGLDKKFVQSTPKTGEDVDEWAKARIAESDKLYDDEKDGFKYFLEDWKDNLKSLSKSEINTKFIGGFVFKEDNWTKTINKHYKDVKRALDECMNALRAEVNKKKDDQDLAKVLRAKMAVTRAMSTRCTKTTNLYNIIVKKIRSNYMSLVAKVLARTGVKGTAESVELDYFMETEDPEDDADEIGDFVDEA